MNIHTLTLGDYQTNTYILQNGDRCAVIDPGYEPETVLSFMRRKSLTLDAILLTHGHFDHVGGVRALAAETDCKVYLHEAELSMPPMMTAGPLYYTDTYGDGDTVTAAGLSVHVLHTPGHTPGSVCLIAEDTMFSGDTLFAGSCGRTDFDGGSAEQMRASLRRLGQLPGDLSVYPGHGESSTLSYERRQNLYLREAMRP